jgi:peroxiredoxin
MSMKGLIRSAAVAMALGMIVATSGYAAVSIGDKGPAWSDLEGTDGQKHSLADLADAKAVVVVFTCNHCPVAKAYEDRLVQLQSDYQAKDVQVVAINVNNGPPDRLDKMKVRAEEKGFNFQYLYDPSQEIGRAYDAKVTPHVFLLDKDRKIAYVGAIDDNMKEDKVGQKHLRDAIDATLAGKTPATAETRPVGCSIKYE